jgi:prepilin-type N-terminal cleavage/methylation domain-containing protein
MSLENDPLPYHNFFSLSREVLMKRKNEQGFTLVEVIVVAVIVAVLAAVAIPLYNGYIKDSRANVCQNNAASIASAYTAAYAANQGGAVVTTANAWRLRSASDNAVWTNIILPKGYEFTTGANSVTVTGPGNSTSKPVEFSK